MVDYVKLPDGSLFPRNEGESYGDAVRAAYAKYPEAFGGQPNEQPKKGGVAGALGLGLESLLSSYRTAAGAVTDPNKAAQEALARQQALGEKYTEPTSLERVKKAYKSKVCCLPPKKWRPKSPAQSPSKYPN